MKQLEYYGIGNYDRIKIIPKRDDTGELNYTTIKVSSNQIHIQREEIVLLAHGLLELAHKENSDVEEKTS